MLELQLAEMEALEKAATPAPWSSDHSNPEDCVLWHQEQFLANVGSSRMVPVIESPREALVFDIDQVNCSFLALLRNAAPQFIALAKAVQELEAASEFLEACGLSGSKQAVDRFDAARAAHKAVLDSLSAALPSVKEGK